MDYYNSDTFLYVVLPVFIFFLRICDVSLDTMRIIFLSKGNKWLAPILGFFQILIWVIAIGKIMENLNNWNCYLAYAGGFAVGNYVGMYIEKKIAIGIMLIRIITKKEASELIELLRYKGYGVTSIKAEGTEGEVAVLYTIIQRNNLKKVIDMIKNYNPNALYTIEDIRFINKPLYHHLKANINK